MDFLRKRREIFLNSFKGGSLCTLIQCLIGVLDQIECLPLHLFEQVIYPTSAEELNHSALLSVESVVSDKPLSSDHSANKPPLSCPLNSSSSCFDFSDLLQSEGEEYSQILPRGLIAPPLRPSGCHSRLTGGGVRGLVDRRILLLLGAWLPSLQTTVCAGSVGTSQMQDYYSVTFERSPDSMRQIRVNENGKSRTLFLSRTYYGSFNLLAPVGAIVHGVPLLKEWCVLVLTSTQF